MSRHIDTIAAPATPAGTSALAVVRASGPDTKAIATAIAGRALKPRHVRHCDYRSLSGELIDDVLIVFFQAPASYTGEDSLEISCHGNPLVVQKIFQDLLARGCRAATPGEFTRRAFVNGRIDLSQAEAVCDLIRARGERALAAANQQLRGGLARRIDGFADSIIRLLARVEVYIDFPDEELPPENRAMLVKEIAPLMRDINMIRASTHYDRVLREGVYAVIIGLPNAGKSSLLNRLVGRDRALVSPEPGTTRDAIEETLIIAGYHVTLIDTAGLNETPSPIEALGMTKTIEAAKNADIYLVVVDSAAPPHSPYPSEVAVDIDPNRTILVFNKCDLTADMIPTGAPEYGAKTIVAFSARTGLGFESLIAALSKQIENLHLFGGSELRLAVNARHNRVLELAHDYLLCAVQKLAVSAPTELIANDLRAALNSLGDVARPVDSELILNHLFAEFCIGK